MSSSRQIVAVIVLTAIFLLLLIFLEFRYTPTGAEAQVWDVNYIWQQRITVTTDSSTEVFSSVWRQACIYVSGCDVGFKLGGKAENDTTATGKKAWITIPDGGLINIEPATGLSHMKIMGSSSGYVYIIGYKQTKQY